MSVSINELNVSNIKLSVYFETNERGDYMTRKNLIKFRIDLGISSKEMANKLGVTTTKYSNIENCRVKPSIDFAYKLQEVFDVEDTLELLKEE